MPKQHRIPKYRGKNSKNSKKNSKVERKDSVNLIPIASSTPPNGHDQAATQCPLCIKIASTIIWWNKNPCKQYRFEKLGPWRGFIDKECCGVCLMVVKYMVAERRRTEATMFTPTCPMVLMDRGCSYLIASNSKTDPHQYLDGLYDGHPVLCLVPSRGLENGNPRSLKVNPLVMDLARIRQWTQFCDQSHLSTCHNLACRQVPPPVSSLVLLDIQQACLIQQCDVTAKKYVALSYVWGQIPDVLETTSGNFEALCVPGALSLEENASHIPKTIMDSMMVCRATRIRYLWIDRLCIVQDSPDHLHAQLQQMASIYAHAYFSIIAVDRNDADYGLPGVCTTSPRSAPFEQLQFNFSTELQLVPRPRTEVTTLPWHTRAWTFQERILSPRALVFTGDTVYWACRASIWFETLSGEPDGSCQFDRRFRRSSDYCGPGFTFELSAWPDLSQYFALVGDYNNRKLTFEKDALHAFSAITTAMSSSFPGGFIFGIPTFLFDIGLLWSCSSSLKRRHAFPSWSWLGWTGPVHLGLTYDALWHPLCSEYDPYADIRIFPLIDWMATYRDGSSLHPIDNSYHHYTAPTYPENGPALRGWRRTTFESASEVKEGFEHSNYKGNVFNYPFPTSLPILDFPFDEWPSYLTFKVKSCVFHLGECRKDETTESLPVDLEDEFGRWVGVVETRFTDRKQFDLGRSCKTIAVSHASVKRRDYMTEQPFIEMNHIYEVMGLDTYDFYNILWVEMMEGVAYREAIGRVWKEAWDRQNPVYEDIILG